MITHFFEDDDGYKDWSDSHRSSFVLNCANPPSPHYVILHRSACHTINGTPPRGNSWTAIYQKVCSDSVSELDAWSKRAAGATPSRCDVCHP